MSKWVSVNEMRPDRDDEYIVTYSNGLVDITEYDTECENFYLKHEDYLSGVSVIAWMPLPEPYKEVDGG